jgi:hypothetical protein
MDILTRMRRTTVADLEGVRSDFDDLPTPVYTSRRPKDMVRIVEGADDLKVDRPAPKNPGMVKSQDWSHNGDDCNNDRCCAPAPIPGPVDARSARQIEVMASLHMQLADLDPETAADAVAYTTRMTVAGKWTAGREGNASDWIGRMIRKVRELKARPVVTVANDDDKFQAIPNGYYAVADAGPDDIHYFRVSRFRDGGIKVQEQASDTLHPVRRGGRRTAILTTIQHVGPAAASALYGQTIGRCGRCNRTLTDATSRSYGIGPECRSKM